ncbi:hypothetical protein F7725_019581 [Dissostichus mawsoni]|uniref:Uncharacterized protein n=1 Tax=Dissostichus mawsoni TaxID=36200 RepID=A0A7J5YK45_DISMA|nr:hypothetical protein F7725_019581 [Dissostichus mawsoni]
MLRSFDSRVSHGNVFRRKTRYEDYLLALSFNAVEQRGVSPARSRKRHVAQDLGPADNNRAESVPPHAQLSHTTPEAASRCCGRVVNHSWSRPPQQDGPLSF